MVFDLEDPTDPLPEGASIHPTGENYVPWLRALMQERPDLGTRLVEDLQPVIHGLKGISLQKGGPTSRFLELACESHGVGFPLLFSELSDGQRSLAVLYTILRAIAPRSSLLIFDEPDNFVAGAEIQPWLAALRESVVESGVGTLLVISHHPEVVDYLAADRALVFRRTELGPTQVTELQVDLSRGLTASEWLRLEPTHAD